MFILQASGRKGFPGKNNLAYLAYSSGTKKKICDIDAWGKCDKTFYGRSL
jgi:hypothetical protein